MSTVKNLKIGNNTYSVRDGNTYCSLSSEQETTLLSAGTYNGEGVQDGEIFNCADGSVKEFDDYITYEDSTEALGWKLPGGNAVSYSCAFSFGADKGVVFKNGERELCVKENAIVSNQQLSNYQYLRYFNDGAKLYRITTNNSYYRISTNGESWGNEASFTTGLNSGQLSRANFYKALGKVFAFVSKGSNEGENIAYAYANSVEGTWTVGTLPEGVSATDDCRVLVFSDEIRLLDLTTSKLYYTTDLTQGFTDTELTPTYPGSNKYFVVGDVAFYDKKHVGYSIDKGASWDTTNLDDNNYHVVYLEETQAFVALKVTTSHTTTNTYYVSANGYQWTSKSSTPNLYGLSLIAGPNSAYTMDDFNYASTRIYSGARHNRSLTRLEGALPSQTGNSGKFLTTDGTNSSWAAVDALPSQTGQSGKFLTTDGTDASWVTVSGGSLPSQAGNAGKFLTTDGTDASWATVSGSGGWGAPDYAKASDIATSPTSSNKATATEDGYLVLRSSSTNVDRAVYIEDVVVAYGYAAQVSACVPIASGQEWYLNGTFQVRKFVPLK